MKKNNYQFYRSTQERILFGVCGGLSEYFHIDPTLIRVLFVFLFLINGSGLIIYLVLAMITPKSPAAISHHTAELNIIKRKHFLGYLAIFLGLLLLIKNFAPAPWDLISNHLIWPLLIISFGVILIFKQSKL